MKTENTQNRELNKEELMYFFNLLNSLENPDSLIYKDFLTLMIVKPYVNMIEGKNPDGQRAFKFELNENGLNTLKEIKNLLNK